jgi:hypothetical protein
MNNKILKFTLFAAGVVVVLGLCIAIYMFYKPQRNIANEKASFILTAGELYKEFSTNETQANQKYLSDKNGKIIQISGTVSEIIARADTAVSITIKDDDMRVGDILCSVGKTDISKAAKFKTGDKIVVKGECTGYMDLTNEVSLSKCVIIE